MIANRGASALEKDIKAEGSFAARQVLPFCQALATLALFALACMLWLRITKGQFLLISGESFRASLAAPLGQMLPMPLRVVNFPWMIPVYALLLAVFVFVPIAAGGAYRLPLSGIFVLLLGLVAQAVYLAMAVMIGCMLVARRRDTKKMHMLLLVAGLAWPAAFLLMVAWLMQLPADVQPVQRWVPVSWQLLGSALALLACITLATSKSIKVARWVLPILLSIYLVGGWAFFQLRVGLDELDYALIDRQLHTAESIFAPVTLEQWQENHREEGLGPAALANSVRGDMQNRCERIIRQCRDFHANYPQSKRAPMAIWIMGQCQSLQVDETALDAKQVRFTADWTQQGSLEAWSLLVQDYPTRSQATLAMWRLGVLALRRAEVKQAEDLFFEAQKQITELLADSGGPANGAGKIFTPLPSLPAQTYYRQVLDRVILLRWWMRENKVFDKPESAHALAAFISLNPYKTDYATSLAGLLSGEKNFSNTLPADNIKLALVLREGDVVTKTKRLVELAAGIDDAAVHANYRLGLLLVTNSKLVKLPELKGKDARKCFKLVAEEAKPNPWQKDAKIQLNLLSPKSN